MRNLLAGFGLCIFLPPFAICGPAAGTCERTFEAAFRPGSDLRMRLRSGDIEIRGGDSPVLRVTCHMQHPERAKELTVCRMETRGWAG